MKIDVKIAQEICSHEGVVLEAYFDSVRVLTWSVGITSMSGHNVERYRNNPQTLRKCLEVYLWVLEKYAKDVRAAFKGHRLKKHEFAAALSFHYNTGAINRASWVKDVKAGNRSKARQSFMAWRKPPEIVGRRQKERDLFFDAKWSSDGKMVVYEDVFSNGQINWKSAKRQDISKVLADIIGKVPEKPEPPQEPTETTPEPPKRKGGLWGLIVSALGLGGGATGAATTQPEYWPPVLAVSLLAIVVGLFVWIRAKRK